MFDKYTNEIVQIIYIDRKRQVSIRDVKIISVKGEKVKAFCYTAKAYRIFNTDNIIDVELSKRVI